MSQLFGLLTSPVLGFLGGQDIDTGLPHYFSDLWYILEIREMPTIVPIVILVKLEDKPVLSLFKSLIFWSILGLTLRRNELKG